MANRIEAALRAIAKELTLVGARFAVVGGLAVSARARPRMTGDVDLAVAVPDDAAAEATIRALVGRGYGLRATIEHRPTGRLATARLDPPSISARGVLVDLLFAASGIEQEIVAAARVCELGDLRLPTATTGHLIAMKILSMGPARPDDHSDLLALLSGATAADLALARASLVKIAKRGFAGRRDLLTALERLKKRAASV